MAQKHLTLEEREAIARGLSEHKTLTAIALDINRSPSAVGRELARNPGPAPYSPSRAHEKAQKTTRTAHRRPFKIAPGSELEEFVRQKLRLRWSPRQISEELKKSHPPEMQVSHETIYQYILVQGKGEMRKELVSCLRQARPKRRKRGGPADGRGQIPGIRTIRERPPEVEERAVPGHWEGDLIVGKDHKSAVLTLVERSSRFLLMTPVPDLKAATFNKALRKLAKRLPAEMTKTITYDRGKEMSNYQSFTVATNIEVFFCDPHSPWQRGTNENTNGLVRDFFPKGTDFREVSFQKLAYVQRLLNERPRETLGWITPAEALSNLFKHLF